MQHLPAMPAKIINTNGAGDCVVAGALSCLVQGLDPLTSLAFGMVSKQHQSLQHLSIHPDPIRLLQRFALDGMHARQAQEAQLEAISCL